MNWLGYYANNKGNKINVTNSKNSWNNIQQFKKVQTQTKLLISRLVVINVICKVLII